MAGLRPFLDFDSPPQLLNGSEMLGRVSCLCSGEAAQPWQRQDHPPAGIHPPAHGDLQVTWLSPFPNVRMVLVPNPLQTKGAADESNAQTQSFLCLPQTKAQQGHSLWALPLREPDWDLLPGLP